MLRTTLSAFARLDAAFVKAVGTARDPAMRYITRSELYDLAWSKPLALLASDFGMTGNGLKKICAKFGVPVPQRGYWAKVAAGKPAAKIALPHRDPGAPWLWEIGRSVAYRWPTDPEAELSEPERPLPVFDEALEDVEARIRKLIGRLRPPGSLELAHPEIRRLLSDDEERVAKGREFSSLATFYKPLFASGFELRRLKILNGILLGAARLGGKSSVRGETGRDISIHVRESWVRLTLDHPSAKPDNHDRWNAREGKADKLKLSIRGYEQPGRLWGDEPGRKLEQCLADIVVAVFVSAEDGLRESALHRYTSAASRREEMRREIDSRRHHAEAAAREKLLSDRLRRRRQLLRLSRCSREATDLRNLINVVERSGALRDTELQRWRSWATEIADELDPLRWPTKLIELITPAV